MNIFRKLILVVLLGNSVLQASSLIAYEDDLMKRTREALIASGAKSPAALSGWLIDPRAELVPLLPMLDLFVQRWGCFRSIVGDHLSGLEAFDMLNHLRNSKISSDYTYQSFALLCLRLPPNSLDSLNPRVEQSDECELLSLSDEQSEKLNQIIPLDCPIAQRPLFYRYARAGLGIAYKWESPGIVQTQIGSQFDVYFDIAKRLLEMRTPTKISPMSLTDTPNIDGLTALLNTTRFMSPDDIYAFILNPDPRAADLLPDLRTFAEGWKNLRTLGGINLLDIEYLNILTPLWTNKIAFGYTFQSFKLLFRQLSPDALANLDRLLPESVESDLLEFSPEQSEALNQVIPLTCPDVQRPLVYRYVRAAMSLQHEQIGSQFEAYLDIVRQLPDIVH
ncbi:MAG: hypothetical protein LBJ77_03360 [Holosporales bacterium]|jgi:hypothetical protein|nr:hypothetical protein [Holosporales bacterium]